ncbi:DivIVA domain-containing protein [Dyadobacter sp. LHD-138]|uniref:DivIVA domain-containing protein n=1 Tax=Dyadobacter sp. LHD-138 TaxID=3071413 RepID=UPI0027DEF164|nr:DivIVA domain-containing protein [Dyadobacter sp. LHD-138]MDQ6479570.1 DivIVA domain-containing protein [Dyadobacter sp. LHD-138]
MKISAIDIRKHTFEKIFRGYNPDEVDAFLNSLSQEWERFSSENSMLKMQLEYAEKELSKLKDIESTLFRTLKSAEDVSRQIEKEAIEAADKRVEESKVKADSMIEEAEQRTNQVILETENRLKKFKEDFALEIKNQERDFRAIENFRDNLVVQLSSLANNTIETVGRFENKYDKESVLNKMEEIKQHVAEIEIPKKGTPISQYVAPEPVEEELTETEEEIVPDVALEIVSAPEEEAIRIEEPAAEEIELVEEEILPVVEAVVEEEPEPVAKKEELSAADAATEALAEMHKSAERARETASPREAQNTFKEKSQEPVLPKSTGGSFFDQI